jgi:hypothetical protein
VAAAVALDAGVELIVEPFRPSHRATRSCGRDSPREADSIDYGGAEKTTGRADNRHEDLVTHA